MMNALFRRVWEKKYSKETKKFMYFKAIEELGELITALSQNITKDGSKQEIVNEIGDVYIQIHKLTKKLNVDDAVYKRIQFKLRKHL